tara:strand:- start:561 stop:989 length:429 start_codon:yes stop_codon:yes gene_type:complete
MIKYKLRCINCLIIFDSWFASSKEYEKLKRLKHINCHNCNSLKVEKTLMSPSILNSTKDKSEIDKDKKFTEIRNKLKEYKRFIKNNFEYVGEKFAYEARSIHYDDKKKKKGIYGKVTKKEAEELKQEGINTDIIPWVNESDN